MHDVTIAILAGGQSRRMGRSKSFVPVQGKPMIEHILERLAPLKLPTILITHCQSDYRQYNLPMFSDVIPGQGALGGIYTALHASKTPYVLCVACDMPFLNIDLLHHLLSLRGKSDAVAAYFNGVWQIFPAIYRTSCTEPFRTAIEGQRLKMQQVLKGLNVYSVHSSDLTSYDPGLRSFININTPSELEMAQARESES